MAFKPLAKLKLITKNFTTWLFIRPKWIWLIPLGVAISLLLACIFMTTLIHIFRTSGAILQIMGVLSVAYGLKNLREKFDEKQSVMKQIFYWFNDITNLFNTNVNGTIEIKEGSGSVSFEGNLETEIIIRNRKDVSLEERVQILEKKNEILDKQIKNLKNQIKTYNKENQEKITEVSKNIQNKHNELKGFVEKSLLGTIHWELIGLGWIGIGVLFATFPDLLP